MTMRYGSFRFLEISVGCKSIEFRAASSRRRKKGKGQEEEKKKMLTKPVAA